MPQQRPGHAQQLPLPQTEILPTLLHLGHKPLYMMNGKKKERKEEGRAMSIQ
jgi:hypothetical protein